MNFLKLIRYKNLLMLALMQVVFHFGFLKPKLGVLALADWQFVLLILSTICIAAAGYIINDIYDKTIDRINKPDKVIIDKHISENTAFNFYIGLNIVGVGIGFYLSNFIDKPSFSAIFIIIAATLYLYASSLKKSLLIGNIIIAVILAISVLIVGIYDLIPLITPENRSLLAIMFEILVDFALFAFLTNLIREIIKDFEDIEGDLDSGAKTLPIVLGTRNSKIITSVLLLATIAFTIWYIFEHLFDNELYFAVIYIFALILAPLIYVLIRLWSLLEKKDYAHLSLILKGIIFFGILTILVISLNIEWVKS